MASDGANQNNQKELSFNLNDIPANSVSDHDENDHENRVTIIIRPSREGTLLLDLNVEPNQEFESPILELEVDQIQEEEDDVLDGDNGTYEASQVTRENKRLSNRQRWAIYNALLERSANGKLPRSATKEVSQQFSVHVRTVQRVWQRGKETAQSEEVNVSRRYGKCGRKRIHIDFNGVAEIPLNRRTTLRSLAESLNISYSTLYRAVKRGLIRRHSNSIKPYLKEEHKRARLRFCISMLDPNTLSHEPRFINMYNMVHIDEKWFYMTKKCETYYLLPVEEEPLRTCQSKNFIRKVMFLVAMARPRFDDNGEETFSGKIGVFPFVIMQPAQRRSSNREAGTLEMKPITSIKRETIKEYFLKFKPSGQEKT